MDAMNILSSVMQDPEAMKKAMNIASMLSSSGALDGLMKNVSGESSSEKAAEGVLANTEKHSENGSPSNPRDKLTIPMVCITTCPQTPFPSVRRND
jgi:hypothetical protein